MSLDPKDRMESLVPWVNRVYQVCLVCLENQVSRVILARKDKWDHLDLLVRTDLQADKVYLGFLENAA